MEGKVLGLIVTGGRIRRREEEEAVPIRRKRVRTGNCSEDSFVEEGEEDADTVAEAAAAKRVERSEEFKEAIVEDAETDSAMGTERKVNVFLLS